MDTELCSPQKNGKCFYLFYGRTESDNFLGICKRNMF